MQEARTSRNFLGTGKAHFAFGRPDSSKTATETMHQEKLRACEGAQFFGHLERYSAGWRGFAFAQIECPDRVAKEEPDMFEAETRQEIVTWLTQMALLRGFPTWHNVDGPSPQQRRQNGKLGEMQRVQQP
ncbi:hypothetical protein WG901_08400 [Novosphingobium sp. PS1R-30]|uniref:Uncharacterized protein n=1 Tax=Novosphingobium anseongense TaxID=3133436 RepID=A0ABU8RUA5_9SPHN